MPQKGPPEGKLSISRWKGKDQSELKKALDDASHQCRNLLIFFMLTMIYLIISSISTTHEDLLRNNPVTLPILNVKTPLKMFYIIAPIMVLVLHINLLINLREHSKKLKPWKEKTDELYPFLFNIAHTDKLVLLLTWISVFALPFLTLLFIQLAFLPYHDIFITLWHPMILTFDVVSLIFYWEKIRDPDWTFADVAIEGMSELSIVSPVDFYNGLEKRLRIVTLKLIKSIYKPQAISKFEKFFGYTSYAFYGLVICWFLAFGQLGYYFGLENASFSNLILKEQTLLAKNASDEIIAAYINRNKHDEQNILKHIRGLNLKDRDLRLADFTKADLRKVDLRDADLSGAKMQGANLCGADLTGAIFKGVYYDDNTKFPKGFYRTDPKMKLIYDDSEDDKKLIEHCVDK